MTNAGSETGGGYPPKESEFLPLSKVLEVLVPFTRPAGDRPPRRMTESAAERSCTFMTLEVGPHLRSSADGLEPGASLHLRSKPFKNKGLSTLQGRLRVRRW